MGDSYLEPCDKDGKRYDHAQLDGEDEDSEELAEYEQIYENEGTEAGNNLVGQLTSWPFGGASSLEVR